MSKRPDADPGTLGTVVVTSKEKAIRNILGLAKEAGFRPSPGRLALIKPNVCGMYPPSYELLESLVKGLKPYFATIVIGETPSSMRRPEECFAKLGIDRLVEAHGITARNLMRDTIVNIEVPKPHTMGMIPFPNTLVQADLLVNCPGLGTHGNTLLTCALKNLFGLIAESHKYATIHQRGVSEVIADIYQVVKPQLSVVDCGSQVIIGRDALSVDIIAAGMKNLDASKVSHLRLAAKDRGLDIEKLHVQQLKG